MIQIKDEKFILVDLGSTNGTFVNGEEITGATEIHQDDEIRIGNTVFVLKTLQ
jgi:pSer/pThr/pTyr-binding forkhead associated (FHA) protein